MNIGDRVMAAAEIVCDGLTVPAGSVGVITQLDRSPGYPYMADFPECASVPLTIDDIQRVPPKS